MSLRFLRHSWSWAPLLAVAAACNAPNGGGPTSDFPFTGGPTGGGDFQPSMDAGVQGPADEEANGPDVSTTGGAGATTGSAGGALDGGTFTPPTTSDAGADFGDAAADPECSPDAGPTDAGPDAGDADPSDADLPDAPMSDAGEAGTGRTLAAHPNPCDRDGGAPVNEAGTSEPTDTL